MWSEPSRRNPAPAMKYFASFESCAASSAGSYGSVRTGGARPGSSRATAVRATAMNVR